MRARHAIVTRTPTVTFIFLDIPVDPWDREAAVGRGVDVIVPANCQHASLN